MPPFEQILQVFATADHYTIGNFLMDFFHAPPTGSRVTGRSECHGKMLSAFLRGTTSYGVGEVLQQLDAVARRFQNLQEPLYALTPPYESLKSGHPALTSYAAQKVRHQLSAEQHAAVDPEGGLHIFAPRKRTEPINMRLSWDTYGSTTFEDVQAVLVKHQPLTFEYIRLLAIPERHNPQKEYRYRPPSFVREKSVLYVQLPMNGRSQHRYFARSTTPTIEMRSDCKFSMESSSWSMGQRKLSSITRAEYVLLQATTTSSTPSRS